MSIVASNISYPQRSASSISITARRLEAGAVVFAFGLAALLLEHPLDEVTRIWIVTLAAGLFVVWIVVQDLATFTIADGAIISIACLALANRWLDGDRALSIGLDCILTGGVLLVFREIYYRRRGFDGLGLGDVKLSAAAGFLVGATAFAWALLAASLLAIGLVGTRRFACHTSQAGFSIGGSDRLAFGAFLAPAVWCAWVAQQAPLLLPFSDP